MRKFIAFTAILFALTSVSLQSAKAETVKNGDSCSPVGATFQQGKTNFICTKYRNSGVWKSSQSKASPTPTVTYFTMPNVIGMNLQLAQDLLQSKGSYLMSQTDAKGLGRFQVLDSNWKVCKQSPGAGQRVSTATLVTLASVKLIESC